MVTDVMNLRIRGANKQDFTFVEKLYSNSNFEINFKHLERLMVIEDEHGIIAVGSLATILEASFVTDPTRSQRSRVIALTALLKQVDREVEILQYTNFHVFATNDSILKILKHKFKFVKTSAKQVLLRWIKA